MANAPSHAPNPASDQVTIFDSEGNSITASRLNAVDLVRGGTHFWKAQDVNVARPEADGPADPSAAVVTIYDAEGTPYELDSANARDMINSGDYFWNDPKLVAATPAAAETPAVEEEPSEVTAETETPAVEETAEVEEAAEEVTEQESLEAEALRVSGEEDVVAYLEGFSEEALRTMAQERFGEKIHHRASKTNVIAKIVEFEEARLVGDDQADA